MITVLEPVTLTAGNCPPSPLLVAAAAESVYRAWLPMIGEIAAREQARAFARHFQNSENVNVEA